MSIVLAALCLSRASSSWDFWGPAGVIDASDVARYHHTNFMNVTDDSLPLPCLPLKYDKCDHRIAPHRISYQAVTWP